MSLLPQPEMAPITPREIAQGVVTRACPCCSRQIVISLPAIVDTLRVEQSAAIEFGLLDLTPREQRLFEALYRRGNAWSDKRLLLALAYEPGYGVHNVAVYLCRLKAQLRDTPWRIERAGPHNRGLYRLRQGVTELAA